jgi:transcriptional regulator with XRE-family HTH domain
MQETAVRPNAALGDFLRSRRAKLDPDEAGVVSARRRRVQGLRREELAELAGMSVDYYTRLEQGRHASASPAVLDSIARALRLPEADRAYLHCLASPGKSKKTGTPAAVRPETRHLMQALGESPAILFRTGMEVLATNEAARRLYVGFEELKAEAGNGLRWMMTDPRARDLHGDQWAAIAADMIGMVRLRIGGKSPAGGVEGLVDELATTSEFFRRVWQDQTVSLGGRRRKLFRHPRAGQLEFGVESLAVQHAEGQILAVLTPEPGSECARAWHEEMSRPV